MRKFVLAAVLDGTYTCQGTNPGSDKKYEGTVMITPKGENYTFTWNIGGKVSKGVGLVNGDLLSVAYTSDEGNTYFGLVVYEIMQEGKRLEGQWTVYPGSSELGQETLTIQKSTQ